MKTTEQILEWIESEAEQELHYFRETNLDHRHAYACSLLEKLKRFIHEND